MKAKTGLLSSLLWLWVLATATHSAERNILVIVTDDESPTLGCYGDEVARTPAIDQIATDGVVFRNAFATTASCSASRSVILSGVHNHRNGQFGHEHHYHKFTTFRDVGRLTLPNVLRQAGYRTGHIGKYHVGPESVYHFDTYLKANQRNPVEMARRCEEFIKAEDSRPFLLYFATADPHRGGGEDSSSRLELKPDLFGNKPNRAAYQGVVEQFFAPDKVPVPAFLSDTAETREELAQYYQACSRVDAGVAELVRILKSAGLYDKTLIVFTSDHGMAFAGSKTTVYDPGLRVPMVVRDPYQESRGFSSDAMLSHVDLTPTLVDFAGALDRQQNSPRVYGDLAEAEKGSPAQAGAPVENSNGGKPFNAYQGRSWMDCLKDSQNAHAEMIFASHTFHEIQMYYPMRAIQDSKYKLIWNIANPLPFPFASDLWSASSWQAQFQQGLDAKYGQKTVGQYIHRPRFELYDMQQDPHESRNLADQPEFREILAEYQRKLRQFQQNMSDPWLLKWDYE